MSTSRSRLVGRLALESAVIIASILAAFALDTWWDGVQERQEEEETLLALETEFQEARETILFYRSLQDRILAQVTVVSDVMNEALLQGRTSVSIPDSSLALAFIPPTTSVSLGTLRGLVSSGRLGIIRDRELRSRLSSWGVEVEELAEEELDSRALAHGDMDRAVRARINTSGLWEIGNALVQDTPPAMDPGGSRIVPIDTEILGVFNLRRRLLDHGLEEALALADKVDDILALIDAGLER